MPADGPLRVLRLYFRHPPEPGGMEQHIQRLSDAQRRLGIEVVNVFNRGESSAPSVHLMPATDLGRLRPQALRNAVFYTAAALDHRVRQLGRSAAGPLVVHAHGAWSDFLFARWLATLLGARATIGSIHGKFHPQPLSRVALDGLNALFATGRRDFEFVRRLIGDRAVHMPSAPEDLFFADLPAPVDIEFDLVSVGSLVPVKRLELLLQCAAQLSSRRFAIVGSGPEDHRLRALKVNLNLDNVTFLGNQTKEQVRSVLGRSRAFVSTSTEEGTPTAMLEALAMGLPVVMTPSNDYGWIVGMSNGIVTKGWSLDEMIEGIEAVLDNPDLHAASLRQANRARMKSISWDANAASVTRIMLACTGHPGATS